MDALDIMTFVVFLLLVGIAISIFVFLGMLPGKIAVARNHPQADAVRIAGWLGVITLGILWPIAMIWAFRVTPLADTEALLSEIGKIKERIDILEATAMREEKK